MSPQHIFITGATGLLGSHLLRALRRRYPKTEITALRRPNSNFTLVEDIADSITWHTGDILEAATLYDLISESDEVYHAAGLVSFHHSHVKAMLRANIEGTTHVVNACLEHGVPLLHVSSAAAIGRSEKRRGLINEKFAWEPSKLNTRYAYTKFMAEQEVWRGMAEGLRAVIVNPTIVLGAGATDAGASRFFRWIDRGLPFYPPGGNGVVDARDVAAFSVALMRKDAAYGHRYILNGANISYRELLTIIADAMDRPPPKRLARIWMRHLAWIYATVRAFTTGSLPGLTRTSARTAAHTFAYDHSRSIAATSLSYRSLRETVQWIADSDWAT